MFHSTGHHACLIRAGILFLIVVLAGGLRLTHLGTNPNGFYQDEADFGYDGHCLVQTGRDMYGVAMPLFGEVIDGLSQEVSVQYLIGLSTHCFGLNEFAVRFPIALVGIFSVWILYFLVKRLFGRRIGLLAAFFLAISPWHIQFSRISFAHILTIFFFCLGLIFFLNAIRRRPWHLYISLAMFLLSIWTYQSARVFVPLFLVGLLVIFRHDLGRIWRHALAAGVLFFLSALPLFLFWISPAGMGRASSQMHLGAAENLAWYFSYLGPVFLFLKGDPNIRHHILGGGQLYFFEAVTVLGGLWWTARNLVKKESQMLVLWLLLYPIPAAFTQPDHALRSLMGAPLFSILSAAGVAWCVSLVSGQRARMVVSGLVTGIVAVSLGAYIINYFVQYPRYGARAWQYGMREAIGFAEKSGYDKIVISNSYYSAPRFVLFYGGISPAECQRNIRQWLAAGSIGRYHFRPLAEAVKGEDGTLWMMNPLEAVLLMKAGVRLSIRHVVHGPQGDPEIVFGTIGK